MPLKKEWISIFNLRFLVFNAINPNIKPAIRIGTKLYILKCITENNIEHKNRPKYSLCLMLTFLMRNDISPARTVIIEMLIILTSIIAVNEIANNTPKTMK